MAVDHAIGAQADVRSGSLGRVADELIRPSRPALVTPRTMAAALAAVLAGAVVVILRQRGAGALGTIWAEDGTIFLAQSRSLGAARSLLEPYAGYVHAVPRLASMLVAALPLPAADAGFAVVSAISTAATAAFVFRASSSQLRSLWARLAVSAPLVIAPLGGTEILGSVANLHWYLLYAAFWAVIWRAPSRQETALAAVVVVLAALSDPFVLLLAPLVGLRLLASRWRPDAVVAGFALAGILQLAVAAGARGQRPVVDEERTSVVLIPARFVVDVAGRGLAGDRFVGESGLSARGAAVAGLVLAVLAVLVFVRRQALPARAGILAALVGTSALYFAAPVAISGVSPPRYGFAPALLLLVAVVVLLEGWDIRSAAPMVRTGALVAGAAMAVCWAVGLPSFNARSDGPAWDASLAKAGSSCAAGTMVAVDLTPAGWVVQLPCDDVVAATGLTPVPAAP